MNNTVYSKNNIIITSSPSLIDCLSFKLFYKDEFKCMINLRRSDSTRIENVVKQLLDYFSKKVKSQ